jgi:hypothetical protein
MFELASSLRGDRLALLRAIFRWVAALSAFFGLSAIAAEILKRWMENNGYLDHPEKGIAWLLSALASIPQYWWFYPSLMFVIGLAVGLWTDLILRRLSDERQRQIELLGSEMISAAHEVKSQQQFVMQRWPQNISHQRSTLASRFERAKKFGIYIPSDDIFNRSDGALILHDYLDFVGTYLFRSGLKPAKRRALETKLKLEK